MSVKWSGGSGGGGVSGATADEVVQIDNATKNIGLNSLRLAIGDGDAIYEMVDGFGDAYTDATEAGVNTGSSSGQSYNAVGEYYVGGTASTHSLLIQSGGDTNGSTTFADSTTTHTPTAAGNAQHSTTEAKFGDSSIYFDGTGDNITIPHSDDWTIDNGGSYTIELQFNPSSLSGSQSLIAQTGTVGEGNQFAWNLYLASAIPTFIISTNGTTGSLNTLSSSSSVSTGTWYHLAVVFDGSNIKMYLDGTQVGSITQNNYFDSARALWLGDREFSSLTYTGYMEEVSILKGTARYTTAFTAPSVPYSVSATDMTLIGATQTANSAPTNARMVVLYDPIDASTLNTDCTMELSMDGGSTWSTAFTLTKEADYDSNVEILTSNDLTLDSTSGTSIVYRFKTLNSKTQRIHGVYVQWR